MQTQPPEELLHRIWLVQHVSVRKLAVGEELAKGIDGYFVFKYMGWAEFEYGALPGALKLMRKQKNRLREIKTEAEGTSVNCWYVGSDDNYELAEAFFKDQLKPQEERIVKRLKERTDIRRNFLGKPEYLTSNLRGEEERGFPKLGDSDNHDGWWSIENAVFVLLRNKDQAELWLKNM